MVIDGDWKIKVRTMKANGKHEGAKRELRKAKMSKCYEEASKRSKIFVDYCLAHYAYTEKDFELTNRYLKYIKNIFEEDDRNIKGMKLEYSNYLWMYTKVNHKHMTLDEICKNMTEIYEYYLSINEYSSAISAIANIYHYKGEGEKLLEKLEELLNCPKINDYSFINGFLNDCEDMSHNLYIRALELIDRYKVNIDIV